MALVVLAAMAAYSPRRRDLAWFAIGALVVVAPWQGWVAQNFDTALPTTAAAPTLVAATDTSVRWGIDIGSVAAVDPPLPDDEADATDTALEQFRNRIGWHLSPPVMVARALRAWDLWPPRNTVERREDRGLANPGGAVAAVAQAALAALALLTVARSAGRAAIGPIALALLAAATLGAALTYGEREVVAPALPAMVVAAAVQVCVLVGRLQDRTADPIAGHDSVVATSTNDE